MPTALLSLPALSATPALSQTDALTNWSGASALSLALWLTSGAITLLAGVVAVRLSTRRLEPEPAPLVVDGSRPALQPTG